MRRDLDEKRYLRRLITIDFYDNVLFDEISRGVDFPKKGISP